MPTQLLIIFIKNINPGKVKTRLARTIGDTAAVKIYQALVDITENATTLLKIDRRIYFSETIVNGKWEDDHKRIQQGRNLGERMRNAFIDGFRDGYSQIILIGSDLPSISKSIIEKGFIVLNKSDVVFGPASDGGYYLIGMSKFQNCIFENKPWSTPSLLYSTLEELKDKDITVSLLDTLNDIDTLEDLRGFPELIKLISI